MDDMTPDLSPNTVPEDTEPTVALRAGLGGVLMGLANLVPGISGGTMLLAAGIYPNFIRAVAELSTLKFHRRSLTVLAIVVLTAAAAILLFAGPVKDLVVDHRWVMYSVFIGLTLGGVPIVWAMAKPATGSMWFGFVGGFAAMVVLAWVQMSSPDGTTSQDGAFMMVMAGIAGASAMILPGVSGGYLLLVLGVYVPILSAIDAFKDALTARDLAAAMAPGVEVILPVGLGVLIGVFAVSNAIQYLLEHFEKPTLGGLLGLLVGAVVGLWPFQTGVPPEIGTLFHGQPVTQQSLVSIDPDKFPIEFFAPDAIQFFAAVVLVAAGLAVTMLVARLGSVTASR